MTQDVIERPIEQLTINLEIAGAPARTAAPAVFRRQERFWEEIRKRIAERNPAVRDGLERLY